MKEQNIFDNQEFFNNYYDIRNSDDCYNDLLEQPAMVELLPNLNGKTVLDLGCGYGYNCIDFINRGAKRVVGLDISKKMLDIANEKSSDAKIEYINMNMTEVMLLNECFDFVFSSLAFHYIENFTKLINDIFTLLNQNGYILFSQEHPIRTATIDGKGFFNRDENGNCVSYTFSNYNQSGRRKIHWFVDGVINYHRPIGEILTIIAKAGFIIEEICEPVPNEWAIKKRPSIIKEFLKPDFLIVKARKG